MTKKSEGSAKSVVSEVLVVGDLPKNRARKFRLEPSNAQLKKLAEDLQILGLKKLLFEGQVQFNDQGDLILDAELGVSATQECVVTLEPVKTRIDTTVVRRFCPDHGAVEDDRQMLEDEDENIDPLGETVDLGEILLESIALNLPDFPRVEGAALEQSTFAEDGVTPLKDEDTKPFAGLAALKDKLESDN